MIIQSLYWTQAMKFCGNTTISDNYFVLSIDKRNNYKIGFIKKNSDDKITIGDSIIITNQE